ncbi:uncharacterized protein [Bemisia tabaci]|uniref:uncharacterized protein isoform X1 n=1 Tax=Bemisia tabaci TaxID=7038 RepID=UPI003B285015
MRLACVNPEKILRYTSNKTKKRSSYSARKTTMTWRKLMYIFVTMALQNLKPTKHAVMADFNEDNSGRGVLANPNEDYSKVICCAHAKPFTRLLGAPNQFECDGTVTEERNPCCSKKRCEEEKYCCYCEGGCLSPSQNTNY